MAVNPTLTALFNAIVAGQNTTWCDFDLYTITPAVGPVMRFTTADFNIATVVVNFTGSISGTAMTVSAPAGTLSAGQTVAGAGVAPNTTIVAQTGGTTGGAGTYTVSVSQTVGSGAMTAGYLFTSQGVRVDQKQSKVQAHWKVGLDSDTWTVVFMPRPVDPVGGTGFPDTIGGVPWLQAASAGALDAADFQVDRAYFATVPTWPMPPGGMVPLAVKTIFAGVIAQLDMTDLTVTVSVNDYRSLLQISMPRHFYQAQCRHMLGDSGCTVNLASYAVGGTAAAGSTQAAIVAPGLATPGGSGTYALGTVQFTSGLNAGYRQTVTRWAAPVLQMTQPFPFAVAAGDTFTAYPGCDYQLSTCGAFANTINFGGFPYIPPPESAT